ncbi:hypothetical protein BDW62DRAFT_109648 [Aspergillus aurantiobrunneus]
MGAGWASPPSLLLCLLCRCETMAIYALGLRHDRGPGSSPTGSKPVSRAWLYATAAQGIPLGPAQSPRRCSCFTSCRDSVVRDSRCTVAVGSITPARGVAVPFWAVLAASLTCLTQARIRPVDLRKSLSRTMPVRTKLNSHGHPFPSAMWDNPSPAEGK